MTKEVLLKQSNRQLLDVLKESGDQYKSEKEPIQEPGENQQGYRLD